MTEDSNSTLDDIRLSLNTVSDTIKRFMCRLKEAKETKKRLVDLLSQTVEVEDTLKQKLRIEIKKGTQLKLQLKSFNIEQCVLDFNEIEANNFLAEFEDDGEKEKYVVIEFSSATDLVDQSEKQFIYEVDKETLMPGSTEKLSEQCLNEASGENIFLGTLPNGGTVNKRPFGEMRKSNKYKSGLHPGYMKSEKYGCAKKKSYMKYRSKMSAMPVGFRQSVSNSITSLDKPNFLCFMCNKSFPSLIDRKKHEREDHQPTDKMIRRPKFRKQKTFSCPICGEGFMMCHDMQRHARDVHYASDPNMCDECGKTFVNRFNLRAHKKLHSDEKPFECNICDKRFKTNSQLTKHGYVHTGEKRYKCLVCDTSFTHTFQRRIHMTLHTGELPQYMCRDCPYKCHFRGSLVKHMRIHTGEKPYLCCECGKSFADSSAHKTHMLMHSGLRPFSCSSCSKTFRLKGQLKLHQRIHTGDKRYVCNQCGARYMYSKGLRDHMEKHTGLTRYGYTCSECNRKFITASNLEQHMHKHNSQKEENVPLDFFIEGSY